MLFDEKKRKKLLANYEALNSMERKAYRALSVVFVPQAVTNCAKILNTLMPMDGRKTFWNSKGNLLSMLERWKKADIVKTTKTGRGENKVSYWCCHPLLIELATRESVRLGEYEAFDRIISGLNEFGPQKSWNGRLNYRNFATFFRSLRSAVYMGSLSGYRELTSADISYYGHENIDKIVFGTALDKGEVSPYLFCLANPLDEELILKLPEEMGADAICEMLNSVVENSDEGRSLWAILLKYRQKYPNNVKLGAMLAFRKIYAGKYDEAGAVLKPEWISEDPETGATLAVAALIAGEPDRALAFYEQGIKVMRKLYGKRKAMYLSFYGLLYPPLLVRAEEMASLAGNSARAAGFAKKFDEYIALETDRTSFSPAKNAYKMLASLQKGDGRRGNLFNSNVGDYIQKTELVSDFLCFALLCSWLDPQRVADYSQLLCEQALEMAGDGMMFAASEIASVLREFVPETAEALSAIPEPAYPLRNLITYKPAWESTLEALAGLIEPFSEDGVERKIGTKRVVWEVDLCAKGSKIIDVEINVLEQSLQGKGWSKGRKLSLRRLVDDPGSVESLTKDDFPVLAGIGTRQIYYSAEYYFDPYRTLSLLVGSQKVFKPDGGERIEVVSGEPRLSVEEADGMITVKMDPFPSRDEIKKGIVLMQDGPNVVRVVQLTERHGRMAALIGEKGMTLPSKAREALAGVIAGLSSVVTVHSDMDDVAIPAESLPPDSCLYVQMQPREEGLDVAAVTRPLGMGSMPCKPGVGAASIFGLKESRRVQTRRDIPAENTALEEFLKMPSLSHAEETGEFTWHIPTAEKSLELLLELQDTSGNIVAEWPQGDARSVKRVDPAGIKLSVASRGAGSWFELTGEIEVDEGFVLSLRELMELIDKKSYGNFLPLGEGRFAALTEEFRRRVEELGSIAGLRGDSLWVNALAAPVVDNLAGEVGLFEGTPELKEKLLKIDEASKMQPALPSTFRGELRPYQEEGFKWLVSLSHWGAGACLADDMGLGKTVQALALLIFRAQHGPALVVAPTSVCSNWLDEALRFAPTLNVRELKGTDREETVKNLAPHDVLVTSYGLLHNESELLCSVRWSTVVLDEAQNIKNMGTKRSAAAMKLDADFRVITTGTPLENNLSELWNLFRFINPDYLASHDNFNKKYAIPIERDANKSAKKRLKRIISPFILRRTKSEVLTELPQKTEITLRVPMKEGELALYEALRRKALEEAAGLSGNEARFTIFAHLMKLRRACCNSELVLAEGKGFPSAKLEAFSEIMDDLLAGGHKTLVFSQFVSHLAILRRHLDAKGVSYKYLDGSTPPAERRRQVAEFQSGEGDAFLISLKAGGSGLNLTAADYVIHMDPWWNPAVEEQASDRTHRIGQNRPVTVYRIVAKDTIEEKIVDLHSWKRDLAESLLSDSQTPTKLSADEMLDLLRER